MTNISRRPRTTAIICIGLAWYFQRISFKYKVLPTQKRLIESLGSATVTSRSQPLTPRGKQR